MRIAIIDLGTNTFNLLVAEISSNHSYKIIFNTKIAVKLGEGGINSGVIAPAPFQRGIDAMKAHCETLKKYNPEKIFAFATSAVRSAKNGNDFVAEIKKQTGIEVNIISGEKEAELIYEGVRQALEIGNEKALVMDIGGGSTEFIICNNEQVFWKHSFDLGVSRMYDFFKHSEPITPQEILKVENYLSEKLQPLFRAVEQHPLDTLIGSSGSFDTFAEMIFCRFDKGKTLENRTSYEFNLEDFYKIHQLIVNAAIDERYKMEGLIEMRVDMIVLASLFTNFILRELKLNKMRLSTYALKEGVLSELTKP
ncbi:MAG: Exopolyphosphatase 2 [Bacteroidia bacterium]|nr:Exopolyphosphatase 2 [Bacteroidia bacterium]